MEWLTRRLANKEGGQEWVTQITAWVSAVDAPFPPVVLAAMNAAARQAVGSSSAAAIRAAAEASSLTGKAALEASRPTG